MDAECMMVLTTIVGTPTPDRVGQCMLLLQSPAPDAPRDHNSSDSLRQGCTYNNLGTRANLFIVKQKLVVVTPLLMSCLALGVKVCAVIAAAFPL